jgi:hypothetical protein
LFIALLDLTDTISLTGMADHAENAAPVAEIKNGLEKAPENDHKSKLSSSGEREELQAPIERQEKEVSTEPKSSNLAAQGRSQKTEHSASRLSLRYKPH